MKKVKCDLCDHMAKGEDFDAWMQNLMPHYKTAHADVMADSGKTKEDGMRWMAENKVRFDAA